MATLTTALDAPELLDWGVDANTLWIRARGVITLGTWDPQTEVDCTVEGETTLDISDLEQADWPTTDDQVAAYLGSDFTVELEAGDDDFVID